MSNTYASHQLPIQTLAYSHIRGFIYAIAVESRDNAAIIIMKKKKKEEEEREDDEVGGNKSKPLASFVVQFQIKFIGAHFSIKD